MIKVSIIVSYTNTYPLLKNFLTHIQKIISTYGYEIVLVQDGEVNESVNTLVSDFITVNEHTKLIKTGNIHLGYSKVNNLGANEASGDYLLFINTDVFPEIASINVLVENLESSFKVGIAQGLLIYPQTNAVQSTGHIFGPFFNNHALCGAKLNNPLLKEKAVRQGVTSAFYIIRKQDFLTLEGFDEYFYNAWDGLDLSLRVTYELKKQCLFIPDAKAYHTQGGSRESIFRNTSYQDGYFWQKWKNYLIQDFHEIILQQLASNELSIQYTIVNCSSYPLSTWDILLSKLRYKKDSIFHIERYSEKEKIVLVEKLPLEILEGISPILFLADHYLDIKNNDNVFETLNIGASKVVDLYGNIYRLPDSKVK